MDSHKGRQIQKGERKGGPPAAGMQEGAGGLNTYGRHEKTYNKTERQATARFAHREPRAKPLRSSIPGGCDGEEGNVCAAHLHKSSRACISRHIIAWRPIQGRDLVLLETLPPPLPPFANMPLPDLGQQTSSTVAQLSSAVDVVWTAALASCLRSCAVWFRTSMFEKLLRRHLFSPAHALSSPS